MYLSTSYMQLIVTVHCNGDILCAQWCNLMNASNPGQKVPGHKVPEQKVPNLGNIGHKVPDQKFPGHKVSGQKVPHLSPFFF